VQKVSDAKGQETDHDDGQQSQRYVALDRTQTHEPVPSGKVMQIVDE